MYYTTPEEFNKKVDSGISDVLQRQREMEERRYACFMRDMSHAEYVGIENYRKAKEQGQNPKKWKIKVDLSYPEHYISEACERYREAGWKQVNYNAHDIGIREPQGEWIITINIE